MGPGKSCFKVHLHTNKGRVWTHFIFLDGLVPLAKDLFTFLNGMIFALRDFIKGTIKVFYMGTIQEKGKGKTDHTMLPPGGEAH